MIILLPMASNLTIMRFTLAGHLSGYLRTNFSKHEFDRHRACCFWGQGEDNRFPSLPSSSCKKLWLFKVLIIAECTNLKWIYNITLRCGIPMEQRPRKDVSDGYSWWCRSCKGRKTIRKDSFFEKSKLSLQKWLLLIHYWARQLSVSDAEIQLEVDKDTAVAVYQWLREVCSTKLLSTPIILRGPDKVVQIDESLFRHKPKVIIIQMTCVCMCSAYMSITVTCTLYSTTEELLQRMRFGCLAL